MRRKRLIKRFPGLVLIAAALLFLRQGGSTMAQTPKPAANKRTTTQNGQPSDGALKFQQNCSRCHKAPEGFSARISGTIVRHMRVRASLSKQDAEAILHFLNP